MKRLSILILILCACFVSVAWGQQPVCKANTWWPEFHRLNMRRWNPCEKVLDVNNVGNLELEVELHHRQYGVFLARRGEWCGLFRLG